MCSRIPIDLQDQSVGGISYTVEEYSCPSSDWEKDIRYFQKNMAKGRKVSVALTKDVGDDYEMQTG